MYLVININNCNQCDNFKTVVRRDGNRVVSMCTKSNKVLSDIIPLDSEKMRNLGVGIPEDCPLRPSAVRMTKEEYDNLDALVEAHQKENPEERKGQALFNVLFENFTEIAEIIRGTRYDTFYLDEKISSCYEFIYSMFVKE